jgi:hypothetical protein
MTSAPTVPGTLQAEESVSVRLPIIDHSSNKINLNVDAAATAQAWLDNLARGIESNDVEKIVALLDPQLSSWRDVLALTWDFRFFVSRLTIGRLLKILLGASMGQRKFAPSLAIE